MTILKEKKTKKLQQTHNKKSGRKTKSKHRGGYAAATPSSKSNICSKNINDLLVGEFKRDTNMFDSDPKKFAKDLKDEAGSVKNAASGNWLSLPGPPPSFPKCVIM